MRRMNKMIPAYVLSFLLLLRSTLGQDCASNGVCDSHERCPVWKEEGECELNKTYMNRYCPVSCGSTETPAQEKERLANQSEEFGIRQEALGSTEEKTLAIMRESIQYMKTNKEAIDQGEDCRNKQQHCSFWTAIGKFSHCFLLCMVLVGFC
jgi:hypothetical protein